MGVRGASIRFTGPVPTSVELIAALCQHTGESITYTEERGGFECSTLKEAASVFAIASEDGWELMTGDLHGNYFWFALLVVLEKLGGLQIFSDGEAMYPKPAPTWAYRPG
jgi:hypothetical protein